MTRLLQLALLSALSLGGLAWCAPAHAQTPPTRVSGAAASSWTTTTSPKTVSISWVAGDIICAGSIVADSGSTLGLATTTGETFSNLFSITTSSHTPIRIDCVTATGSGSSVNVSMTRASTANPWGMAVWVYRDTGGMGTCTNGTGTARTISRTNSAAHSADIWIWGDWSAAGAPTGTPTPTTIVASVDVGADYSLGAFDLTDQTSAGAVSYGATGAAGSNVYAYGVCEIKGAAGGTFRTQVGGFLVGP